jgi:hypothetical protein
MCWSIGTSWSTRSFHAVTRRITTAQLKPGDAVLKAGYHIRLFYAWLDDSHTSYVAYEAGTLVGTTSIRSMPDDLASGFHPVRYNRISDSPAPANVLLNGSFDVWARSWGTSTGQPVWWTAGTRSWQTSPLAHRTDVHKSGHNSLQLSNTDTDPRTVTEMSQTVTVTAETTYAVSAWAKTADAAGLVLRISYLDAAGDPIAGPRATGDEWGVDDTAFHMMSMRVVSPAGAVRAIVTLGLGGGTSVAGTTTVPGTSAVLDDVSLARPQLAVGMAASATTIRRGRTVTLSGSVAPTASIGATATVSVQKPGMGWFLVSAPAVSASGSTASWRSGYHFSTGARKGVYHFKVSVPGVGDWLGATSKTVSVTVR